ncbi:MAG: dihydrolipoamide acetyltransferase family protein [Nocardioides sp.]
MAEFTMPSLGADMESGTLLEWLVKPGDAVHRGDPVAVVDTDKAAIEVESFHDGVVGELLVGPGTRVVVGAPMAGIDAAGTAAPMASAEPVATPVVETVAVVPGHAPARATPPVRHHAAELGVDLAGLVGTGPHGEVRRADVDAAARAAKAPPPPPPPPPPPAALPPRTTRTQVSPYARRLAAELGVDVDRLDSGNGAIHALDVVAAAASRAEPGAAVPTEALAGAQPAPASVIPLGHRPGRAAIAALMARSKREIPHYYVAQTVDLGTATEWLHRTNRSRAVTDRIVPAAAILRATALAAREIPELNGFWVDGAFVRGEAVHLGVAVSVRDGALVTPAIRNAADLVLSDLMAALRDLVRRARAGRLTRAEMADPTLTVTDLGDQGVEELIGAIYPPQVALLGVGRIVERPWAVHGLLGVHPVVRLTLSGDHRATDGVTGSGFLATIDRLLQHPEEL